MKRNFLCLVKLLICLSFVIVLLYPCAALAQDCEPWVGKVKSVQGTVEAKRADQADWQPVQQNDTFCPGDMIRVGEQSRADLALANQSVLRLDANSEITLQGLRGEKTTLVDMFKGAGHFFSRSPRGLEVKTPFTIAGVRGTEFFIGVQQNRTLMSVYEGVVLAQNDAGSLNIQSGQSAVAEQGKAPVLRVVAKPRDAVHWALYYPPVFYVPPGKAAPEEDTGDPRFYAYRASQLLTVGRVVEANADLDRAMSLDANYSDAYALRTIIFIVQNDKDRAFQFAQRAVSVDPNSATARIAMSYAQQASFDLEGARASLEQAVELEPDNALAWARLSEIWASFGRLNKSLEAAQKAESLSPDLSRTQTVLGFAYLMQVKTKKAREAFEKAISLDQADPMPRLGLGLAMIRDGKLKDGGSEIEVAASLDPNNSLIRSYMGKVYYEEKRTKLDQREYDIAKELDPNDPTPWFYGAIAKQTTNRPVEALHDMQKAIELNDNQAVYRSQLQLDSDLAARSSSLARIYNNLGFEQRGLVEGWDSVNTDPTNFSAHRFLSDTYSALPRHEIARVSELLQSQLLQPTNITPIQPLLAESNLFLISGQGPSAVGFNTYNPLFNRNQGTLLASGFVGENSTWGAEGVASGIYGKLSLSGGYTHFESDGWRINNDQEDDVANIFAQFEITHKTSIQAEYRYRETDRGDQQLSFFDDAFFPDLRQNRETDTWRLGLRHAFTPANVLIGNFSYQDAEESQSNLFFQDPTTVGLPPPPPSIENYYTQDSDEKAYTGELQHLLRSQYINTVIGAGYFNIDQEITTVVDPFYPGNPGFGIPPIDPPPNPPVIQDLDIKHTNLYLYSYINALKNVTFTVGASGDFFDVDDKNSDDQDLDKDQFNPKFGVTWNIFSGTTLRGAAFRTFKRTLVTDQTLEPTQVAGFNQFFDDGNATEAWVYGGAIDQKFSRNIYGGATFTYRDMTVPYFVQAAPPATGFLLREADWEEYMGRAYLYWTPHKWLALTAEYGYEKIERAPEYTNFIKELKTHQVPLGINFYHPSGVSAGVKGTYYDQEGAYEQSTGVFTPGSDDFWIVDAAISYRLPKRYGFLTLGVNNLLDEQFRYADIDIQNPEIQPERSVFGKVTLAFP